MKKEKCSCNGYHITDVPFKKRLITFAKQILPANTINDTNALKRYAATNFFTSARKLVYYVTGATISTDIGKPR